MSDQCGHSDDEREVERRVLDVVRDLFTVLDAHGYRRTSDDAALGRAVVAVWGLVEEYEGQAGGATPGEVAVDAAAGIYRGMAGDDRLSLELARDVFAVFDAHGFTGVGGDVGVGRAVGSVWQAARDYEGRDAARIVFDPDPDADPHPAGRHLPVLREGDPEPASGTRLLWADGSVQIWHRGHGREWTACVGAWGPFVIVPAYDELIPQAAIARYREELP